MVTRIPGYSGFTYIGPRERTVIVGQLGQSLNNTHYESRTVRLAARKLHPGTKLDPDLSPEGIMRLIQAGAEARKAPKKDSRWDKTGICGVCQGEVVQRPRYDSSRLGGRASIVGVDIFCSGCGLMYKFLSKAP